MKKICKCYLAFPRLINFFLIFFLPLKRVEQALLNFKVGGSENLYVFSLTLLFIPFIHASLISHTNNACMGKEFLAQQVKPSPLRLHFISECWFEC